MIAIADLVKSPAVAGNYFAFDAYVQGDIEAGLVENRQGKRLVALPEVLLEAIYAALAEDVGQASGVVLFNCGRWWGKNFYRRFAGEISMHYGKPIAQMSMVELLQCWRQCWKTHGWGTVNLDLDFYAQGFLVVKTQKSLFAQMAPKSQQPACAVEAGLFSAFFSQLTGRDLHCVQTACESLGADINTFVLGLTERLKPAEAWQMEGQDHATIMMRLSTAQQSNVA